MAKERLDLILVQRGLAESRELAQRIIRAGHVEVNGQIEARTGLKLSTEIDIKIRQMPRFVSRGGDKLEAAFEAFGLDVTGLVCLDVGASTGGFTDCLLQHGAARVYDVDVGHEQLHPKLRNDPRVKVMEGVNARYLRKEDFPETPKFAVVDVSFISLTKVLPAVIGVLAVDGALVTLIKPQFEAGREQVEKGGVIRDPAVRQAVVDAVREFGRGELGLHWVGVVESPLRGPAGNVEFLAYWRRQAGDTNG